MMLLFWLLSLLSASGLAQNTKEAISRMQLKHGIPDGTLITFYFYHRGNGNEPESVNIDLYEVPSVDIYPVYDHAHIRIDRHDSKPVITNTYLDGKWGEETVREQPLDVAGSPGWWRVDIHKLDRYRANICFQGFWSDVRTFKISLDDIASIYLTSEYINHYSVTMTMKLPNDILPRLDYDRFKDIVHARGNGNPVIRYVEFPAFPVGSGMEITAWLPASGGGKAFRPRLMFVIKGTKTLIFDIVQEWFRGPYTNVLTMSSSEKHQVECTKEQPNGDLQHLNLERISTTKLRLRIFFKRGVDGITCDFEVPDYEKLDKPIEILGTDGGAPLIINHSIPRSIKIKTDN